MKIDLLYEIQIPLPHGPTTERDYFWQAAAIEYLNYAFRVFASGITPEAAKAGDAPYLSMDLTTQYPLLPKMIRGEVTYDELDQEDMVSIGDVDHVIRKLERYRDAGADRVLCLMQGARIPHPAVMKSIELFGKYVIPEFDRG